ncbi:unnamed protein product [Mytilus coruscus]|uniref:Uncharacterized protein n=1 Tax=Mytilus coruscus TaxID=42192 RepID=A0A6J8BMB6_MYTCO|nr:unnamed protein product [Mytilus coruscus]
MNLRKDRQGVSFDEKQIQVEMRAFICDAPAKFPNTSDSESEDDNVTFSGSGDSGIYIDGSQDLSTAATEEYQDIKIMDDSNSEEDTCTKQAISSYLLVTAAAHVVTTVIQVEDGVPGPISVHSELTTDFTPQLVKPVVLFEKVKTNVVQWLENKSSKRHKSEIQLQ